MAVRPTSSRSSSRFRRAVATSTSTTTCITDSCSTASLYSSVHYPCDYGFIEGSLAEDGDPLDVLVVIAEPTFPGCVVRARPVGVLDMADEKGHDYKILAVAHDDPRWEGTTRLEDLSPHRLLEIENFFQTYKTLERRPTDVRGWLGRRRRLEDHRRGPCGRRTEWRCRGPGAHARDVALTRRPSANRWSKPIIPRVLTISDPRVGGIHALDPEVCR